LAEADYDLGVIAERQGRLDEAAAHYKSALSKKPSLKAAAENLAVLAENKGDTDGALATYAAIAQKFPDDAPSRAHIAMLLQKGGDDERALQYAREALIRDPRSYPAQKAMMFAYYDKKQVAMARLVALRALKVNDADPDLYYALGLMLLAEKQEEKARIQFNKALGVRPEFVPAHMMLAKLALKDEDYAGTQGHLQRVLQADPNNADAHLDLGVSYKGMGQFDKALMEYDAAERLNPKLAAIYLNRGIILHRYKNAPEKGLALYKKYLELRGGEVAVGEGSVLALVKEAEEIVRATAAAAQLEQDSKHQQENQKRQQDQLQELQKRQQEQLKASQGPGGQSSDKAAPPAPKAPPAATQPPLEHKVEKKADEGEPKGEPSDGM
jgi:tetratricopeptide (TPR) repeat protein